MDRQLSIEAEGNNFHLKFHNFQGPFEGHQIGDFLELKEVDPPPEEEGATIPALGTYYMWHAMSFHPDLHTLIGAEKLEAVAVLKQKMHLHVIEGEEFLPADPDEEAVKAATGSVPLPEHISLTEEMEKLHESVWHRGPKAVITAFLARAIPVTIIVFAIVVLSRHLGDHHREVSVDAAFSQAAHPPVQQGLLAGIVKPDHSDQIRVEFRAVRYLSRNRMITADGNVIEITRAGDLRPIFEKAQIASSAPQIDARIGDGKINVQKMVVADEIVVRGGQLIRIAKLPASADKPRRGNPGAPDVFQVYDSIDYDDDSLLEVVEGQKLGLEGHISKEGDQLVVRFENDSGFALAPIRDGAPCERLLELFVDDDQTVEVNVLLRQVYPMENSNDSSQSRSATKLAGLATVYAASAQNYHVVDRR